VNADLAISYTRKIPKSIQLIYNPLECRQIKIVRFRYKRRTFLIQGPVGSLAVSSHEDSNRRLLSYLCYSNSFLSAIKKNLTCSYITTLKGLLTADC